MLALKSVEGQSIDTRLIKRELREFSLTRCAALPVRKLVCALIFLFAIALGACVEPREAHASWGATQSNGCGTSCGSPTDVCNYWGTFYGGSCGGILGPAYNQSGNIVGWVYGINSPGPHPSTGDAFPYCSSPYVTDPMVTSGCSQRMTPYAKQLGCACSDNGASAAPGSHNSGTFGSGDPVNVANGNNYQAVVDYSTSGPNQLAFIRYYNSESTHTSALGMNWTTNLTRQLIVYSGFVYVTAADGAIYEFTKQTSTTYSTGDPDSGATLSSDGSTIYMYTDRYDTVETYDYTSLNLLSVKYRNGYQLNMTYSGGNLSQVTDTYGRTLTFTSSNGVIKSMTDPNGNVYNYTYTTAGFNNGQLLTQVTYPAASGTPNVQYGYADSNYPFSLTSITDENGNQYATWTYDASNRAITSTLAGNTNSYTYSYNLGFVNAGTVTVTNPLGKQAIYTIQWYSNGDKVKTLANQTSSLSPASTINFGYDSNSYMSYRQDENSNQDYFTNDSEGQVTSETDANGSSVARTITSAWNSTYQVPTQVAQPGLTANYTYNTSGQLTQEVETDTTSQAVPYSTNGQTRTWNYTYTTGGALATVEGPLGSGETTTYTYDAQGCVRSITDPMGNVTTVTSVNGQCEPLVTTDPNNVATDYTYDPRGRLTGVTVNPGSNASATTFTLDAVGDITEIVEPNGATLTYAYDNAHRLTSITNDLGEKITYTLDNMGDRTQLEITDASSTITKTQSATFDDLGRILRSIGANSETTQYGYDLASNQTSLTDPRSKVYGYAFDALNRLKQQTDPDTFKTSPAYNGQDQTTSITDARSNVTTYVRDGFGDVIQQTGPDTGTAVFWYDAAGDLIKRVDARSIETDFSYDNSQRLTGKSFPADSAENVALTYDSTASGNDGAGRLTSATDQSGSTSLTYNALGQIVSDQRAIGSNNYATTYTFDGLGNGLTTTHPSGLIVTFSRDTEGRISGITSQVGSGGSPTTILSGATYEPFGPITGATFGNGVVLAKSYDQDYRLTDIGAAAGSTTIQNLSYGYDYDSNITSIADNLNGARSQTFIPDDLNRLASASGAYGAISYTYDGVGNRKTDSSGTTTDTFAYPTTSNHVSTVTTGSNTRTFSYVASGQISEDVRNGSTDYTYTYNNDGRLIISNLNGSAVGNYLYNFQGQRVQKIASGTTTQFIYDLNGHLVEEANSSGVAQKDYIWLDDMPVALVDYTGASPVIYFIHGDQLNRPQKLTDSSASVAWDGVFDPFGNVSSVSGSETNLLMFPGQYYDSETQLSQNWHRDYDPTIGRYLQSDPIGLLGGVNTYAYVDGNPLIYIDPLGLCWVYSQSTGILRHVNSDGATDYTSTGGYSGYGSGYNNPAMQTVEAQSHGDAAGPIPQGNYSVGSPRNSSQTGHFVMNLSPIPGPTAMGRTALEMHGENPAHPNQSSTGCIIEPLSVRQKVAASGDRCLRVTQ